MLYQSQIPFIPSPTASTAFFPSHNVISQPRFQRCYAKRLRHTPSHIHQTTIRADLGDERPYSHPANLNTPSKTTEHNLFQIPELEDKLDEAIEAEEYASAAKIRDKLKDAKNEDSLLLLATLLNYYDAINSHALDRIEKMWLSSSKVICQHPLTPCHTGYDRVIASFKTLFNTLPSDLKLSISDVRISSFGAVAYVTCVETPESSLFKKIEDGKGRKHRLLATSIFEKVWVDNSDKYEYLLVHHVSTPIVQGLMVL